MKPETRAKCARSVRAIPPAHPSILTPHSRDGRCLALSAGLSQRDVEELATCGHVLKPAWHPRNFLAALTMVDMAAWGKERVDWLSAQVLLCLQRGGAEGTKRGETGTPKHSAFMIVRGALSAAQRNVGSPFLFRSCVHASVRSHARLHDAACTQLPRPRSAHDDLAARFAGHARFAWCFCSAGMCVRAPHVPHRAIAGARRASRNGSLVRKGCSAHWRRSEHALMGNRPRAAVRSVMMR